MREGIAQAEGEPEPDPVPVRAPYAEPPASYEERDELGGNGSGGKEKVRGGGESGGSVTELTLVEAVNDCLHVELERDDPCW